MTVNSWMLSLSVSSAQLMYGNGLFSPFMGHCHALSFRFACGAYFFFVALHSPADSAVLEKWSPS